jgi:hypothetical protein
VAFNLDAQWHISAVAGIVLTQSCCAMGFVMPDVFSKMNFQTTGSDLNFDQYIPDVVTISLRQNDGLVDSIDFCSAYVDCIGELRIHCPDATIFLHEQPNGRQLSEQRPGPLSVRNSKLYERRR